MAMWWGFTFFGIAKFFIGFSKNPEEDKKP